MSSKGIFTDCDDSKICPPKPCFNPKKNCEEYRCCVANAVGSISSNTVQNVKIYGNYLLVYYMVIV